MTTTTENVPHEETTDAIPHYGTYLARAATRYPEGSIVSKDENGRAYAPVTADASGYPAQGVAKSYVLNAVGDPASGGSIATGLDDALPVEVAFGIFGFPYTGTAPQPGETLFVVDNHTLSTDDNNGTRGKAGICIETRTTQSVAKTYCLMAPWAVAAAGGSGAPFEIRLPLMAFTDSDGDPLLKFANGASAVPGLNLAASELLGIRWNNNATFEAILTQVGLPKDVDTTKAIKVEIECAKVGATVGDATTFTATAFLTGVGDLYDADANAGGVSAAIVGNAPSTTTQLTSISIAGSDVPLAVRTMTLTVKPTDGTLGTDDIIITDIRVTGFRR